MRLSLLPLSLTSALFPTFMPNKKPTKAKKPTAKKAVKKTTKLKTTKAVLGAPAVSE